MKGGRTSAQTVGLLSNRSQRGVCVSYGHITMVTWLAWRQSFLSASCPPSFVHISLSLHPTVTQCLSPRVDELR